MAETKTKKLRVYKLAADINLSSDQIVEFLKKKGFIVKSHMSLVSDEMMDLVYDHYKKDVEKAQKHNKKIEEFKKSKEERKAAEKSEEEKSLKKEKIKEDKQKDTTKISPGGKQEKPEEEETPEAAEGIKKDFRKKRTGMKVVGTIDLNTEKSDEAVSEKGKSKTRTPEDRLTKSKTIKDDGDKTIKKKKLRPKKKKSKANEDDSEEGKQAKKKKRIKKFQIDDKDVKDAIRKTLDSIDENVSSQRAIAKKKKRKERQEEEAKKQELEEQQKSKIKVAEYVAVNELANLMKVEVGDVITKCIELGMMVSINQRLDFETIMLVADEFGFEVEREKEYASDTLEDKPDPEESLQPRSPVVTIMGHVDHGKTSLLDYIRRTNVVAGESGGITQHIGAYKVELDNGKFISFLDTPGHEAFTAMRARGTQVTDIVVLVVAADDAVMPQTIEAINHAQAANVPIIIAINKIDKPGSNIEKIKQQLAERNILVEDWGGKYQCVEVSAKSGKNVDELLERILLEAEVLELKTNPNREARGVVIDAELDKGKGIVASVLVQKGTLRVGDPFVAGNFSGKVRAMLDERGHKVEDAGPSTPVQVLGLEGAPQAGDNFIVVESERLSKEIAQKRQQLKREHEQKQVHHLTLDQIAEQISIGGVKDLPIIVKGDVDGSVEALSDSLMKISTKEVLVKVIHRSVGAISESDVLLAAASNAIIIGFHVRPNLKARKLAETQKVDIRLYNVIYDAINEVKSALEGLLSPVISEEITATLEVRDTFKVPKAGLIAGSYVQEGKISRGNKVRLIRDGIVIFEGEIGSLKRFKDDAREVDAGYECGVGISNFNDIKVGDTIEAYKLVETKKTLS